MKKSYIVIVYDNFKFSVQYQKVSIMGCLVENLNLDTMGHLIKDILNGV